MAKKRATKRSESATARPASSRKPARSIAGKQASPDIREQEIAKAREYLKELDTVFTADIEMFQSEPPSQDAVDVAGGYWRFWPMWHMWTFGGITRAVIAAEGPSVIASVKDRISNGGYSHYLRSLAEVHRAATDLLRREAERRGIPSGPLGAESIICQEMILFGNPMRSGDNAICLDWPEILGQSRYTLPAQKHELIRDGEAVFMRLSTLIDLGTKPPRNPSAPPEVADEPLTDTEQLVFDAIVTAGRPISGKQICDVTGSTESTLRRHIIPALKTKRGVKNRRGAGYYLPPM